MSEKNAQLCVVIKLPQRTVTFDVPRDVFSTLAEQLRFDALRAGLLAPKDWSKVAAHVTTRTLDEETRSTAFVVTITLVGGAKPIRRIYRPGQIERFRMYVQRQLAKYPDFVGGEAEIHWKGLEQSLEVPLAPLVLPVHSRPRECDHPNELTAPRLTVTGNVMERLSVLANDSLSRGIEQGGCLIGRLPDLDNIVIDRVVRAPDAGGTSVRFCFDPRFWTGLLDDAVGPDCRIVGFVHSHLIDHGHGETLSARDLETAHLHFGMPWSIAGLVCASKRQSSVRWFGWQDGTMSELDEPMALFPPADNEPAKTP